MFTSMLPIYCEKRNNRLREYCRKKYLSHRRVAEIIGNDENSIRQWKSKIDRFCSVTNPQKIADEDWRIIKSALNFLD